MSGLELNKVAAAVLVAGLVALVSGKVAHVLYHPVESPDKRGFEVAVSEAPAEGAASDAAPAAAPVDITTLLATADVAAGEAITKRCSACHDFTKGGPNKVGPNLFGIVGRKIASHEGFTYSDALSKIGGGWDEQKISDFVLKPKAFAPGTKMSFAGLPKDADRANLIAYLKTLK